MSRFSEYMVSHDIDWFCVVDGYLCHFASNGSEMPNVIANSWLIRRTQEIAAELPILLEERELRIKESHRRELQELEGFNEQRYYESFKFFASKGFYSFDYEWNRGGDGGEYRLIVGPGNRIIHPETEFLAERLPHVPIERLNERDRSMFERILNQIRRID